MQVSSATLAQRIQSLNPEQLLKVQELIDSLQSNLHDRAALLLSEAAFAEAWNNPEDDVYDAL